MEVRSRDDRRTGRVRPKRPTRFAGRSRRWPRRCQGPSVERYRYASASHPGVEYQITVDGADVACTCAGFEYRGQCRHARDVKAAIAAGKPAPVGYRRG